MVVGSILHGAYGDYYEQMVALRHYKRTHPGTRLVLFYANDLRKQELEVFDQSFADEVHSWSAIPTTPVDRFLQFQVRDAELKANVLDHLPPESLAKIDLTRTVKPWHHLRKTWQEDPRLCDIGLSEAGRHLLPGCEAENGIPPTLFEDRFTVGFLWRYRASSGYISSKGQPPEQELIAMRSELFRRLISEYHAHILVCGMNVLTTDDNRDRTDNKYTRQPLDLPPEHVTYLQGLSWGLELEIIRRCSLCILMASGFSEALWLKRQAQAAILVDPPRQYLAKLLWNRMPLFHLLHPKELLFQWKQPHSADRVLEYLLQRRLLPDNALAE